MVRGSPCVGSVPEAGTNASSYHPESEVGHHRSTPHQQTQQTAPEGVSVCVWAGGGWGSDLLEPRGLEKAWG